MALLALALVGLAWWLMRSARSARMRRIVAAAAAFGLAGFCGALVVAGFRHFGGSVDGDIGERVHICDAWWAAVATPSDQSARDEDDRSVDCHRVAVDAIGPALAEAAVIGGLVGAIALVGRPCAATCSIARWPPCELRIRLRRLRPHDPSVRSGAGVGQPCCSVGRINSSLIATRRGRVTM